MNKKLIEVAIPLDAINEASAREKSIRHGHPSTLHLWWARRPLATARAVIFASLVDDPSSHPELFPTEKEQNEERQRLFTFIKKLVTWENTFNNTIIEQAKKEIEKYNTLPIEFLDPFSGGGAIPLEAQRLGLHTHAHDLNPISIMINKSMIEIPHLFNDKPPVNPVASSKKMTSTYNGVDGLQEDVEYYGKKLKERVYSKIGNLYPKITVIDEGCEKTTNVIAWIWSRTVKCTNPACNATIPLAKSFTLSKKGETIWIEPQIHESGNNYVLRKGGKPIEGTMNSKGATCLKCGSQITFKEIRDAGLSGKMNSDLMAIVSEGNKKRIYSEPNEEQLLKTVVGRPDDHPDAKIDESVPYLQTPKYGMNNYSDMFTNRQLVMLNAFTSTIDEIKKMVFEDASKHEQYCDKQPLSQLGTGALAYSEAISVYLSFVISKIADRGSTICSWDSSRDGLRNTFGRQAIPMVWDYAEGNPFCNSSGCFDNMLEWVTECIPVFPVKQQGIVKQISATDDCGLANIMVSTDPPYYDNIGYADLSDYFYIWMRKVLRPIYPDLFSTVLVPKTDELVAMRHRFDGSNEAAKQFFENGMFKTFKQLYNYCNDDIPLTIYYAFKQSESEETDKKIQRSSSGWETMLSAVINAGFEITGTWPVRTELSNRMRGIDSNALASSIVLVCRKTNKTDSITRREFINELRRELKPAIKKLQESNIAPVDLAQSSIGPGIAVYSRYKSVLESDGTIMSVRTALQIINQELDAFVSEQEGEMDSESRFCVNLYSQFAYNEVKYGEADVLARAKNTSVERLSNIGALFSEKGIVRLKTREEIPEPTKTGARTWILCQQLTREVDRGGIEATAKILLPYSGHDAENAKSLAYRLFTIADQKKWTQEAYAYNALITAWPDIQSTLITLIGPEEKPGVTRIDRWLQ